MSGLEVAGSAVGIVSLGIQVAGGLLKYYGSWKDYDVDIFNLCATLGNLSDVLDTLLQTVEPPARFDKSITHTVERNISSVKHFLDVLETELSKIQSASPSKPDWKSIMRRHVRRALYPFKEETEQNPTSCC